MTELILFGLLLVAGGFGLGISFVAAIAYRQEQQPPWSTNGTP